MTGATLNGLEVSVTPDKVDENGHSYAIWVGPSDATPVFVGSLVMPYEGEGAALRTALSFLAKTLAELAERHPI